MSTSSQPTNNNDQKIVTFNFEIFKQLVQEMIEVKMPMAEILNAVKDKNDGKLPIVPTCAALCELLKMPLLQVREIERWDIDENVFSRIDDRELNDFFEPWISRYFSRSIRQEHEILETQNL